MAKTTTPLTAQERVILFCCMPSGVTYEQGVRIVIAYIEARPQRMHESFGLLALEALTAASPCKR